MIQPFTLSVYDVVVLSFWINYNPPYRVLGGTVEGTSVP